MRERKEPMTQRMNATAARAQWGQLLNQVFRRERRVLVEKDGIPVAAIVSADDLQRLQQLEQQAAEDFQVLDRFAEPFKNERPEDIEREVAKAVRAARVELRKEAKQHAQHP